MICRAAARASSCHLGVWLRQLAAPWGEKPRISAIAHMVLAVPMKGHAPGVGQALRTTPL